MARFEFKLPDIGEGVAEGEIVAWHVKPGDVVKEDQPMVEVMTDKATVTIGAPKKGTIVETCAGVGQVLPVGRVLVVIETDEAAAARPAAPSASATHASAASAAPAIASAAAAPPAGAVAPSAARAATSAPATARAATSAPATEPGVLTRPPEPAATAVGDIKDTLPGAGFFDKTAFDTTATTLERTGPNGHGALVSERPLATPATRKLARDLGVDLRRIAGSGPGGRITAEDVRAHAEGARRAAAPPSVAAVEAARVPGTVGARAPIAIAPPPGTSAALEERRPFVGVRRKIAERMQTSKNTAAHFTFVEECDVGRLKEMRERLLPVAEKAGVKLTFLPFITKAVVFALRKFPILSSALDETTNELVYRKYVHIGIATATDQGLMVPVVRDADRKSILETAREIQRLATAARNGTIQASELTGSVFTITSLGAQGGLFATPVLNFPEVGILGVHQIKQRPVVRDGQIVIGDIMLLSLSFDHRIVDGHVGAAFAYEIIAYLENPERMLLEMA